MNNKQISLEELERDLEKSKRYRKDHLIRYFFLDLWWGIENLPKLPGKLYRRVKWFIQRGKRGYSDRDLWGLAGYLSKIISNSVKELKEVNHGIPVVDYEDLPDNSLDWTEEDWRRAEKKYNEILDEIIWTFRTGEKVMDGELEYIPEDEDEQFRGETEKITEKWDHVRTMTEAECERFRNGFRLFQKYFFTLWD